MSAASRFARRLVRALARVRDEAARHAVARAVRNVHEPAHGGDELVELGLDLPSSAMQRFVLGTNTRDDRVSMLADLGEVDALPADAFDRLIFTRPFLGRRRDIALANVTHTLRASGEMVAIVPRRRQRDLEQAGFQVLQVRRSSIWRVVILRRASPRSRVAE